MPKHALGRQDALAGTPAMPGTLKNFLTFALQPDIDKAELVSAIERDPILFVRALALHPGPITSLARWPEQVSRASLQALAVAMVSESFDGGADETALLSSFVAAEIGRRAGSPDVATCRLTTLLSYAHVEDLVVPGKGLGVTGQVRLALSHRAGSLDEFRGMPRLVMIVAAARALAVSPSADVCATAASLLSLEVAEIEEAISSASAKAARDVAVAGPDDYLTSMLGEVNRINALYRAVMKSSEEIEFENIVQLAGSFLLDGVRSMHLRPEGSSLVAKSGDLSVDLKWRDSSLASVMRGQHPSWLRRDEVSLLVERQLFDCLEADELLLIPLSPDVGMAIVVQGEETSASASVLAAFSDTMTDVYRARYAGADRPVIPIDELRQRVREITHEVNNPLSIVQNYLATLRLKLGAGAPVKELDAISRELVRVSGVIQKYMQIGETEVTLQLGVASLNDIVRDIVALTAAAHQDVDIQGYYDEEVPSLEFAVDATRQVVVNVMKNAVEAVAETASPRITVETSGSVNVGGRAYVEVTITDNGPGMSTGQRLALFEQNTTTKGEGRGLGMGIVQDLVDRMSGLVACRAGTAGKGTSFQILLPVGQP